MKKYSIRTHVALLTLLPLLVMVIAMETFFLHERFVDMERDLLTRGQLIARQLAAGSEYGVFSNNSTFLKNLAENSLLLPDVRSVTVINASSKIMIASGEIPTALENNGDFPSHATKLLELVGPDIPSFNNAKSLLLYQPITFTQLVLDDSNTQAGMRQAGAVVVEMSWELTNKLKLRMLWLSIGVTAVFLLLTLVLVHLASRRIVQPIMDLSAAVRLIGAGHLETRVNTPGYIDELCTLSHGINQMTADLEHEQNILQHRIDEATKQLRGLAFYDSLTRLPNRRLLNDRLTQVMAASRRSGYFAALMFIDLDNFKPLNDQYGHATGDLLLVEAAHRISRCLREVDTVARFGGDEFVVLLSRLDSDYTESANQAQNVAEKIRSTLAETYSLVNQQYEQEDIRLEHRCTSSIGIVLFLNTDISQEDLLNRADSAMYKAKQQGRNRICFF